MAEENVAEAPINEDRGEFSLVLDGVTMGMRPTFEAIQSIESVAGDGLLELAREALAGNLRLARVAQIATECINAWGRENNVPDAAKANSVRVAKLIYESSGGLHEALRAVGGMLSLAVTGGFDASGNLKPATTKKTDEAPVAG